MENTPLHPESPVGKNPPSPVGQVLRRVNTQSHGNTPVRPTVLATPRASELAVARHELHRINNPSADSLPSAVEVFYEASPVARSSLVETVVFKSKPPWSMPLQLLQYPLRATVDVKVVPHMVGPLLPDHAPLEFKGMHNLTTDAVTNYGPFSNVVDIDVLHDEAALVYILDHEMENLDAQPTRWGLLRRAMRWLRRLPEEEYYTTYPWARYVHID